MVNIILSTVCIKKKKKKLWQVFEACSLKSKPRDPSVGSWRVCVNQQLGNQKRTRDFGLTPAPKGCLTLLSLSQGPSATLHPLQIPCVSIQFPCVSHSGLDFLLWGGCHVATLPFHIQGQLHWVSPKTANISPRLMPKEEYKTGKIIV